MAISILNSVKNEALEEAFKPTNLLHANSKWTRCARISMGRKCIWFGNWWNYWALAPVQFVVPAGTTVDFLLLSVANGGSPTTDQRVAIINLEEGGNNRVWKRWRLYRRRTDYRNVMAKISLYSGTNGARTKIIPSV